MRIDQVTYSLRNLKHRKLRSWLTVLSVLIGITSIFALVSFGLGIQSYVDTLADEAGADKLFLQAKGIGAPGTDENFFLREDDVVFVGKMKGVDDIVGLQSKAGELKHGKETKVNFLLGLNPEKLRLIEEAFTVQVEKGRQLKKGDRGKIVLGYNYQLENKVFKKPVRLGDKVELQGEQFDAVGFYEEVGNPHDDAQMYITQEKMEALYDVEGKFGWAIIKAEKSENPQELAEKITEKLRKFKEQEKGKEDFFVQTFADLLETFGTILVVINGVLVLIALISLGVASVNIMNTMYTAVLERTKEIGVMKAIGAQNRDIMVIFVFESGFLGMVGGIIGVFSGWAVAALGGKFAAASGFALLQPVFPAALVIGCVVFAFLIGALAGLLPALQAAKLKPVDALRYE
ncbi:ABC transporter permease [Candidatus Woesearchaeota archaeon]|nr:ABC transporter permease [Candidatus Woesearchaeota archaeon]